MTSTSDRRQHNHANGTMGDGTTCFCSPVPVPQERGYESERCTKCLGGTYFCSCAEPEVAREMEADLEEIMAQSDQPQERGGATVEPPFHRITIGQWECPDCGNSGIVETTPAGDIGCLTCDPERLGKTIESLRAQLATLTAELASAREQIAELRQRLVAAGLTLVANVEASTEERDQARAQIEKINYHRREQADTIRAQIELLTLVNAERDQLRAENERLVLENPRLCGQCGALLDQHAQPKQEVHS